ncbi:hypothetical protein ZWY2020_046621 [Hordeum vulgare]|nr:hypothetical protein ZWY2020_046621 [Hordeum vulgare]
MPIVGALLLPRSLFSLVVKDGNTGLRAWNRNRWPPHVLSVGELEALQGDDELEAASRRAAAVPDRRARGSELQGRRRATAGEQKGSGGSAPCRDEHTEEWRRPWQNGMAAA